jgi:hypothetical protein
MSHRLREMPPSVWMDKAWSLFISEKRESPQTFLTQTKWERTQLKHSANPNSKKSSMFSISVETLLQVLRFQAREWRDD